IAVRISDDRAVINRNHYQDRDDGERDQRQLYAHMQHDKDDADQDGNFLDQVDDHLGIELVERFHVMGDTSDQPPDRITVKITDMHPRQVPEHFLTDIEDDALTGILQQIHLRIVEKCCPDNDHKKQDTDICETDIILLAK